MPLPRTTDSPPQRHASYPSDVGQACWAQNIPDGRGREDIKSRAAAGAAASPTICPRVIHGLSKGRQRRDKPEDERASCLSITSTGNSHHLALKQHINGEALGGLRKRNQEPLQLNTKLAHAEGTT
ncbi:hypothetical protein TEQG_01501 [Trichophyton equinum CBS 127.97]|uniref:Uncharacterized protein n=1 Tax=Trichophyton equinum (strain ATCC MYA-4606 / CBS 127.97) TaxID=559882 RepID=F2PKP7_TRIEC|nr:hypothetical protein TEQG_01501 [Trichophyton equinum CBS 127.97]